MNPAGNGTQEAQRGRVPLLIAKTPQGAWLDIGRSKSETNGYTL